MSFIFSNGLRPSRYYQTKDNYMVMASEVGVFDTDHANIIRKVSQKLLQHHQEGESENTPTSLGRWVTNHSNIIRKVG